MIFTLLNYPKKIIYEEMLRMKNKKLISMVMTLAIAAAPAFSIGVAAKNVVEDFGFEVTSAREDLIVSAPVYKSSGNVISSISANKEITAEFKTIKSTKGADSLSLVAALYDEQMCLEAANYNVCQLAGSGAEDSASVSVTTPEGANSNYTLRCFVWENTNSIAPYTQAFEFGNNEIDTAWNVSGDWKVVSKTENSSYFTKNGFASLAQFNTSTGDTSGKAWQTVSVKPKTSYLLSYYANISQGASFNCTVSGQNGEVLLNKDYTSGSFINDMIHTGDNTEVTISFNDTCSGTYERVYIDRVSLDENLLTDGDFDNGTYIGWGEKQNNNASALSISLDAKHSGNASLYVNGGRAAQSVGADKLAYYGTGVYTASGWIKDAGSGTILFRTWKGNSYNDVSVATTETSDGWKYYSVSLYLSADDIKNNIEVNPFSTSGTYWIDDVCLTKSDRNDAFDDYGFESMDAIKSISKCSTSETFSLDSGTSHSGVTSLKVNKANQGYAGIKYNIPSANLARHGAGKYKISGWMKYTDATDCTPVVKLFVGNQEVASTTAPAGDAENGFRYFECAADIADITKSYDFRFYTTSGNTDDFWIDDVHLEKIGDIAAEAE